MNSVGLFVGFYLVLGFFPFLIAAVVTLVGIVETAAREIVRPRRPRKGVVLPEVMAPNLRDEAPAKT